ncbi:MipA/OmpV family protein [Orbus sturtevantii]|uniref:MipA/OmpV family protein n=1 Tax=Orbus sturtevantii TaxID=3074109 RepID=UPI00370DDA78
MKKALPLISLLLSSSLLAAEPEHNIGIGLSGSWEKSPYVGENRPFSILPLIDYDSNSLFISGTSGGIHLWQNNNQQIDLAFEYQSFELKPSNNDDPRMKQLDRRKTTLLGGLAYSIITPYGQLSAEALIDTLHNSQSVSIDVEYAGYLQLTQQLALIPQVGATWYNHKHNSYYYGVSKKESLHSGFASYQPASSLTPYLTLTSIYKFNPTWSAVFEYEYNLLSHEVKNSPIVDRNNTSTISVGLLFYF